MSLVWKNLGNLSFDYWIPECCFLDLLCFECLNLIHCCFLDCLFGCFVYLSSERCFLKCFDFESLSLDCLIPEYCLNLQKRLLANLILGCRHFEHWSLVY